MSRIDPQGIYALWWRDVLRFLRAPSRVVGALLTPLLFMVFLGTGFRGATIPGIPAGVDYLQYIVPGIVGFTMLFGASFAGLAILADRDVGFLKEILVSPVSRTSIVLGRVAGGSTTALVQSSLILVLSLFFGFRVTGPLSLPLAGGILLLLAVTFVGFGIALASQFKDSQGFGILVQFFILPLFFLSGALYPLEGLPTPVQYLALANPLTYGVDALRAVLIGTSTYPLVVDVGALLIAAVGMVTLGAALFERVETV